MSLLAQVTRGKIIKPINALVSGVHGVGKTTFASQAPNPIFLGAESGTDQMDVARLPQPKSFAEAMQAVFELTTEKHDFQTLAVDSLDWLERTLHRDIATKEKVEKLTDIPYGRGYDAAMVEWAKFKDALEVLRESRKMHIVLIAHIQTKNQVDLVTGKEFKSHQIKLQEKAAALFKEFVDCILFATYDLHTTKTEGGKERAVTSGKRIAYTTYSPVYEAKNRYGLKPVIELDWNSFYAAVQAGNPQDPEALKASIEGILASLNDKELSERVNKSMQGADAQKLFEINAGLEKIRATKKK